MSEPTKYNRQFVPGIVGSEALFDITYWLNNLRKFTPERWYEWELKSYDILVIIDKENGKRFAVEVLGEKSYGLVELRMVTRWDVIKTMGKLKLGQQIIR